MKWWKAELFLSGPYIKGPYTSLNVADYIRCRPAQELKVRQNALSGPEKVKLWAKVLWLVGERCAAEDVTARRDLGEFERGCGVDPVVSRFGTMGLIKGNVRLVLAGPSLDKVRHVREELVGDKYDFGVSTERRGDATPTPGRAADNRPVVLGVALGNLLIPGDESILRSDHEESVHSPAAKHRFVNGQQCGGLSGPRNGEVGPMCDREELSKVRLLALG